MAQPALRIVDDEIDISIVRRLLARPLRVVSQTAQPLRDIEAAAVQDGAAEAAARELSRLKAEVMVMKAILGAQRREADRLRACITDIDEAEPLAPEAQAVRDRWAALVDTLLQAPR